MKIDQIAYYAAKEKDVVLIKNTFGLGNAKWVEDKVFGDVKIFNSWERSRAKLLFNYDLGIELEILQYLEGPHCHLLNPLWPYEDATISHVGVHLGAEEEFPEMPAWKMVQEMITRSHTNPYLIKNKRRYHYKIFQQKAQHNYLKFIKRIED